MNADALSNRSVSVQNGPYLKKNWGNFHMRKKNRVNELSGYDVFKVNHTDDSSVESKRNQNSPSKSRESDLILPEISQGFKT